jgi:dihydrofolate reductase
MFGSPTAFQTLNKLDVIDEYWVIYYPVFFGKGIPFFTRAESPRTFKLIDTRQLSNGELVIHYRVEQ